MLACFILQLQAMQLASAQPIMNYTLPYTYFNLYELHNKPSRLCSGIKSIQNDNHNFVYQDTMTLTLLRLQQLASGVKCRTVNSVMFLFISRARVITVCQPFGK